MKAILPFVFAPCLLADEIGFNRQILTQEFVAEGVAVADFDGDGKKDIAAGAYLWLGPDFSNRVTFGSPPETPFDPALGYSNCFVMAAVDLNQDGRPDVVSVDFPGKETWGFLNPGKMGEPWKKVVLLASTDNESPTLSDITGDGKPELIAMSGGAPGYQEIAWGKPEQRAGFRAITQADPKRYQRFTHGLGVGDLNGDKRPDYLEKGGWYEQPAEPGAAWTFHPVEFCPPEHRGGAQMLVFDVNGDGRNDVVNGYHAHGYGLGWFEQKADGGFTEHQLMEPRSVRAPGVVSFSQLHALAAADLNGDGLTDFVTGKRHWAHGPNGDSEPNSDSVLYWFELKRGGPEGATFVPHEIDRESGVGTQITVEDVNGDQRPDVVVANKKGVFVFTQRKGS